MEFSRLTAKQLLASGALVAAGVAGIWLPSRREMIVANTDVRSASVVLGVVLISFGVVPLVTRRRHVALVSLILPAALAGALAGAMIWDLRHLGQIAHPAANVESTENWGLPDAYCGWGALLGALVVPLVAAGLAALRTRNEGDLPGRGVTQRLERWHSLLILLALLAALAGGLAGTVAFDLVYPGFYYSKFTHIEGSESWLLARHRAYWGSWGALLGCSSVPLIALWLATFGGSRGTWAETTAMHDARRVRA